MAESKEIKDRLYELRTFSDISTAEMAECAGISENEYIDYESGKKDFTFTLLYNCAKKLGIDITELLLGKSPNLSEYSIVRAGYGMKLKRREGFEYLHVAQYMKNRIAEPFAACSSVKKDCWNPPACRSRTIRCRRSRPYSRAKSIRRTKRISRNGPRTWSSAWTMSPTNMSAAAMHRKLWTT